MEGQPQAPRSHAPGGELQRSWTFVPGTGGGATLRTDSVGIPSWSQEHTQEQWPLQALKNQEKTNL